MLALASVMCSTSSPYWCALQSMARRTSNVLLASPGLSTLAASNRAETRAWSMAPSLSFPQWGISRFSRRWSRSRVRTASSSAPGGAGTRSRNR